MNTATFMLKHPESGSRVFVEFALKKGTGVKLVGATFAEGNVVSLTAIRERMPVAYNYLVNGGH
jgi:hypothetical protein